MSAEIDARARLLAYYDRKANELEVHAERLQGELSQITDPLTRQKAQGRITRLMGLARASRDHARRVRAATSPEGLA
jgi:hypothetical protein